MDLEYNFGDTVTDGKQDDWAGATTGAAMKKLETLAVSELQPGMRTAAAITDETGYVLVPAGAELAGATIAALGRRGIAQVVVEQEVAEDPAALEAYRANFVAQLNRRFRRAGEGEETRALHRAIAEYRREHRE